jgi:wingless-type MMTV integration site family protein 9
VSWKGWCRATDVRAAWFQIVKRGLSTICKCHGVSGSCSTRTCWRQLTVFPAVGNQLRKAYDVARSVSNQESPNDFETLVQASHDAAVGRPTAGGRRRVDSNPETVTPRSSRSTGSRGGRPTRLAPSTTLIYAAESPDFCDRSAMSPGTHGRRCPPTTLSDDAADHLPIHEAAGGDRCDELCCGRGYNVRVSTVRRRCRCRVIWCCDVKCDECNNEVKEYFCK